MRAHFPVATPTAAWRINGGIAFAGNPVVAATVTDSRTVSGRVMLAFTDGDQFRLRAIRTEGGSDLQTVDERSAITCVVYRN